MADPVAELAERCAGTVTADAPMAEHTTLRVGGPARALVEVEADDDLAAVGEVCRRHGLPWLVVGRGSNLLVADAGYAGVVVTLGRAYRGVDIDGERVHAAAAEPLPALAMRVARAGLAGFAWAAAVPGSLGGGVRMNAGAHGGCLADHLVSAELMRLESGVREVWPVDTLGLGYRDSELPHDAVVVTATLQLERGPVETVEHEIREIRRWRREHQPINEPNCGSVFTNPPDDSAGRLIEAVGGKDLAVGGARVSSRHANFIVTDRDATAADVRALIRRLSERVADRFDVTLRPEVVMVGDFDGRPTGQVGERD